MNITIIGSDRGIIVVRWLVKCETSYYLFLFVYTEYLPFERSVAE